ncbi:hypothetical protein J2W14_002486 [Pseudarthrobacter oxydans]|uniref:hypothetical protein n=1 Tax=Pseudarthrobacter oxydans TaxID=1671 RepID=UPI002788AE13|nr:hypothetical protein [Pseudarthrobacter oxydans]MDP9983084.1 hypothetical protein [Pseudarthrobacter oxydans]
MQRPPALDAARLRAECRGEAIDRTAKLNGLVLSPDFANDVSTTETSYQGMATPELTVRSPLPVLGLIGRLNSLE